MLDHFQMGPNLVRGFAPNGIGPRDINPFGTDGRARRHQVLGRVGGIADAVLVPAEGSRAQGRGLCRCRRLWDYKGPTSWAQTGEVNVARLHSPADAGVRLPMPEPARG